MSAPTVAAADEGAADDETADERMSGGRPADGRMADEGATDADRGDAGASGLPVLRPDWSAPAHVAALCTTRAGGVSAPPYDSLNLGLHVGDDEDDVRENRARLADRLGLPSAPHWLVQVHGTRVVRIGATGPDEEGEADGAWTDVPDRVVGVLTADCLPVVVTDTAGTRVAVAHAGWRGLAGGVLDAALAPFEARSELHVWLGPAIGPQAFEVGAEVRADFVGRDAAHATAFVPLDAPGKYLADLYALARRELERSRPVGSIHVSGGDRCTLHERERFHSHRRDGVRSGRMATLAWLHSPGR